MNFALIYYIRYYIDTILYRVKFFLKKTFGSIAPNKINILQQNLNVHIRLHIKDGMEILHEI